jgi:integrase
LSTPEIEAARLLLQRLGVHPEDLLTHPTTGPTGPGRAPTPVPTISDYLPRVASAVPPATRRAYDTYWRRIEHAFGARRLDEPTASEIQQLAEHTRTHAVVRRNARGGQSAAAHLIAAARCLYHHAENDGLIAPTNNPARKTRKPRKLASTRRAIPDTRLTEINHIAATTGNDPELDTLLLRLHLETACRRGGALNLRIRNLDHRNSLIELREKGGTLRWQPVSPTLMQQLINHAIERVPDRQRDDARPVGSGASADEPSNHEPSDPERTDDGSTTDSHLLRYRNGRPITARRYDYLWNRIAQHLPWAAAQGITTHWLRHTTLTWVERNFSYAVARAYAGHEGGLHGVGVTASYVRADVEEVATALAALTGEPHPLSRTNNRHEQPTVNAPPAWWQESR